MYQTLNSTLTPSPRREKKERKVTIVFRRTDEPVHCGGVEALHLLDDGSLLTASRDSTVKRWSIPNGQPTCLASFEGHADWVNDLTVVGDLLFSCSNDKTVRVWQLQSTGTFVAPMCHHSDYVTCVTSAKTRAFVASAGLRGEVFLLDVTSGVTKRLRPKVQPPQPPIPTGGGSKHFSYGSSQSGDLNGSQGGTGGGGGAHSGSGSAPAVQAGIYSLAISSSGSILAAGSSDALIRIWDTRTGEKICKLRGHSENVRALMIKDDCSLMLSGSADGTIRLWDLSMQRCVQTYAVHSDSVWALQTSPDWSVVYSGGRDKSVFRTRLASRTTELLLQEQHAITSLAVNHQDSTVWTSTPMSSVHQWSIPREPISPRTTAHAGARRRGSGVASAGSTRKSMDPNKLTQIPSQQPVNVIPGISPIVAHKVLSDRRHILTTDAHGTVALWDVLAGREVVAYGQVEMDAKERELFEARHCPSWFTAENKLGLLAISLEPPQCFNAEDYALGLGYTNVADDYKLNYGKLVLEGAFAKWRHKSLSLLQQQSTLSPTGSGNPLSPGQGQGPGSRNHTAMDTQGPGQRPNTGSPRAGSLPQPGAQHGPGQQSSTYYQEDCPQYWRGVHPAIICQSASGIPWQILISRFTGMEAEPEEVPSWVGDVVMRNATVTPKESKCAFILVPAEGSNLPSLLQSRLNAPRILQVHKVASYCVARLGDSQIQLELHPVYLKRPSGAPPDPPGHGHTQGTQPRYDLELLCNGVAVPYEMSLSSVKKYIWCKSDDIVFHYRVRDPLHPAPLPQIQPVKS